MEKNSSLIYKEERKISNLRNYFFFLFNKFDLTYLIWYNDRKQFLNIYHSMSQNKRVLTHSFFNSFSCSFLWRFLVCYSINSSSSSLFISHLSLFTKATYSLIYSLHISTYILFTYLLLFYFLFLFF